MENKLDNIKLMGHTYMLKIDMPCFFSSLSNRAKAPPLRVGKWKDSLLDLRVPEICPKIDLMTNFSYLRERGWEEKGGEPENQDLLLRVLWLIL